MKETGILFTPEHIRKIIADQKVQTRRVVKLPSHFKCPVTGQKYPLPVELWKATTYGGGSTFRTVKGERIPVPEMPGMWNDKGATLIGSHYAVGDKLYIKEGVIAHASIPQLIGYYMDGCRSPSIGEKRLTAMFMPKSTARTWLEITNVKVEKVQDISEEDCIAEGCPKEYLLGRNWYEHLWNEINGKKHPWSQNPWVFAISFRKI